MGAIVPKLGAPDPRDLKVYPGVPLQLGSTLDPTFIMGALSIPCPYCGRSARIGGNCEGCGALMKEVKPEPPKHDDVLDTLRNKQVMLEMMLKDRAREQALKEQKAAINAALISIVIAAFLSWLVYEAVTRQEQIEQIRERITTQERAR